jgi:hypothetical protein
LTCILLVARRYSRKNPMATRATLNRAQAVNATKSCWLLVPVAFRGTKLQGSPQQAVHKSPRPAPMFAPITGALVAYR